MKKQKYSKPKMTNLGDIVDFTFGGMGWGGDINSTSNKGGGGGGGGDRPPITGHPN